MCQNYLKNVFFPFFPRFFLTDEKTNSAILKAESLDYEERTHYTLTVGVKDHGNPQLSSQCSVDVQLIDINDNAPVLKYEVVTQSIKESVAIGTYVTKVLNTVEHINSNYMRFSRCQAFLTARTT